MLWTTTFGTERIHITYQSAEPVYCCPVQRSEKEMDRRVEELKRQCSVQAENAHRQYEELAQVTRQLQEAGRKWREKYFEEI